MLCVPRHQPQQDHHG